MDAEMLRREIARFDASLPLTHASTPPASWYVEPDVFALERRAVFGRHWLAVARVEQLAGPGAFVTGECAGLPFVITRDAAGDLHALHNVCRHKAAAVAQGCGRADALTCPYHGWTYDLDGGLRRAPRAGAMADFDREAAALPAMACETWGPYVFVNADVDAPALRPQLASLGLVLAGTPDAAHDGGAAPDVAPDAAQAWAGDLTWVAARHYGLDCNWKVFCDNYLDGGYHVAGLHPELGAELDLGSYATTVHGLSSVQTAAGAADPGAAAPGAADSDAADPGAGRIADRATYAFVHPNLMINRYGSVLDVNIVRPLGPDRCRVDFDFFFAQTEGPGAEAFIAASLERSELVQQQDMDICANVQRGLASGSYAQGRYAPAFEVALHHFHCQLAADLAGRDQGALPSAG